MSQEKEAAELLEVERIAADLAAEEVGIDKSWDTSYAPIHKLGVGGGGIGVKWK